MRQVIRAFQSRTAVTMADRTELLQHLVAGSIAYSCAVNQGPAELAQAAYRDTVMPVAMKVISSVNEFIVLDTNYVLEMVKQHWVARYMVLNSPVRILDHSRPKCLEMRDSLAHEYNVWIEDFQQAAAQVVARGV